MRPAIPDVQSRAVRMRRCRADALVSHLEPIQRRYGELAAEPEYLRGVLLEGAEGASELADQTLLWTKEAMGITQRGAAPVLVGGLGSGAKKASAAKKPVSA
jgi:hypothetical protein